MDDQSPTPIMSAFNIPDVEEEIIEKEDLVLADVGLHPVFGVIEQEYMNEIQRAMDARNFDPNLPAQEYKIKALASVQYAMFLTDQLERIHEALRAKKAKGRK